VLEIGCGPGLALRACAARADTVVGLDHSRTMLDQAARRNRRAVAEGRVRLRLGGLEQLPVLEGPFDRVFSVNVVQFLPDRAAAFRDLFSVLAPGGLIATTYLPRARDATRADALEMANAVRANMAAAGFVDIRLEELPLRPVPAVCVLGARPR
jgi:cyclopropane fatty-acyl-phospholipid synthase-like methyltransferase